MKKRIVVLLMLLALVTSLFVSCASTSEKAAKALSQGNYRSAIEQSLKALDEDSGDEDAVVVLNDAWSRANYEWTASIDEFEKSSDPNVIAKSFGKYESLIEIHKIVSTSGRSDITTDVDGLSERFYQTKKRVANLFFDVANKLMLDGTRSKSRDALAYYRYIKKLMPDYPNIGDAIDEATSTATSKVVLLVKSSDKEYADEIVSSVSEQIDSENLIDLVAISDDYDFSSMEAKDFAVSKDANVIIYLGLDVNLDTGLDVTERPVNGRVVAAPNWNVSKYSLLASGSCNVDYKILDLDTDSILKEGNFDVDKSTDFDFSISLIGPSDVQTEKLEIGNLTPQNYEVATFSYDSGFSYLPAQLELFEKMDIECDARGNFKYEPMSYDTMDFNQYSTPKDLVNKSYNGHKVFPFDLVDLAYVDESTSTKFFFSYLGRSYSYEFEDRVRAARIDRENFGNLVNWMKSGKTLKASENLFCKEILLPQTALKITEDLTGILK